MNKWTLLFILSFGFLGINHMSAFETNSIAMNLQQYDVENPYVIPAEKVTEILATTGLQIDDLMRQLIPLAQNLARPAISNFYVGVVALGKSGTLYLGANLEFSQVPLNQTVHAEQFVITLARHHGEQEIVALALSAAPCGHCRQFMQEMGTNNQFPILIDEASPETLASLLPKAFGPADLGLEGGMMKPITSDRAFTMEYTLYSQALQAAYRSYAPYTNAQAAIAIQTMDGQIYTGPYLENAGFNPSLSPLQTALVALLADMKDYDDIYNVLLLEQPGAKISHEMISKLVLQSIAPEAHFRVKLVKLN